MMTVTKLVGQCYAAGEQRRVLVIAEIEVAVTEIASIATVDDLTGLPHEAIPGSKLESGAHLPASGLAAADTSEADTPSANKL